MDGILGNSQLTNDLLSLGRNPLFNMGMGLLSARYDPNVNPYAAAMGGLGASRQANATDEEAARMEAMREQLAALLAAGGQGGGPAQQAPAVPTAPPGPHVEANPMNDALAKFYNEQRWRSVLGG